MKLVRTIADVAAALLIAAGFAIPLLSATEIPQAERRSGYSFMSPDTKAIQNDDTANPGMLWVLDGEALWKRKTGTADKACADCHDDARASMKGVAARYPAFDKALGRPVNLEQRINLCRARHQQATPLALRKPRPARAHRLRRASSRAASPIDGRQPIRNSNRSSPKDATSSCSGRASSISAAPIATTTIGTSIWPDPRSPRRIPTGYPLYRLEWQSLGSLQRRLRNCITGIRTQPYDYGAPELVELELYLMSRAHDMPIETPAVRP